MATPVFPGFVKTWQLNVNNLVAVSEGGNIDNQRVLFSIKDILVNFSTNPWTVHSSSDGSTTASSDLWIDYTNLVWSTGNHSWIVLEKPSVASTSQILISLDTSASSTINMSWSPNGLFTGGSISVDPTALDQVTLQSNTNWNGALSTYDSVLHVWHSEDGTKTRIVITNDTGAPRCFIIMDTLSALPEFWGNNTDIVVMFEGTNAMSYSGTGINRSPINDNFGKMWSGNADIDIGLLNWGMDSPPLGFGTQNYLSRHRFANIGARLITSEPLPMAPFSIMAETSGGRGVVGYLDDMYAGHEGVTSGTTYPNNSSARTWAQFDDIILPWTNDSQKPIVQSTTTIGSIPDLSSNSNDGTANNMEKRDFLTEDVAGGTFSNFAITTGLSEYISMGDVTPLQFDRTDTFSLSAWFRTSETSGSPILLSKANASARGYEILLDGPNGTIIFELINTTTSNHMRIDTTETFNDGLWHHIVATWDGDVAGGAAGANIYIDGSSRTVSTTVDTLTGTISNTTAFQVSGRNGTSNGWIGSIDDVAIYDKELTSGEVTTIYNSGAPTDLSIVGPTASLVGYWTFENILSTTSVDITQDGMATLEAPVGATETIYYVMIGTDEGSPSQPYYHQWTVTTSPDPTGAQTTAPFGGPLTDIHISATYTALA